MDMFRFLLISLNIEAILQESTISRRRERLRETTDGLGLESVYGATIERIKAQGGDKSRLRMGALLWISHAERPLEADALCYALGVELGSMDFNAGNVPSISAIVGCCQGLVTVDKEASTVRLIHFTLKEYLSARPDIFGSPHSVMAEICLTYLNSPLAKAISADPWVCPGCLGMPFLTYCSVYWGVHAKRELSECSRSLALRLLRGYDGHISGKLLLQQAQLFNPCYPRRSLQFSGLQCASFFGIGEVVPPLVERKCYDLNARGLGGHTPLAWAARNGHEEATKILLRQREVNPDSANNYGQTPLSFATRNGHEGMVRILLGRGEVNPDKLNNYGQTPLLHAAENGHEGVVRILLGRGEVNPDRLDFGNRTPLSFAAQCGHEGVVKILLAREETNPDAQDIERRTPLLWAAWHKEVGVVKILLSRADVKPDKPDMDRRTPLSWVAETGNEVLIKILLGHKEVDPDKPDNEGQTPLSYAARKGHEGMVKVLLEREEVSPDKPDNKGRTPLIHAARNGHEGVVRILLERDEVNTDHRCNKGRKPLRHAWRKRQSGVVRILVERNKLNAAEPDNKRKRSLS